MFYQFGSVNNVSFTFFSCYFTSSKLLLPNGFDLNESL